MYNEKTIYLLNVASGPARDLAELYNEIDSNALLKTTCVEMDPNAIKYAQVLTQKFQNKIQFVRKNALRYSTDQKFDLVWSAGLFDYLEDRPFILLLKKMKNWCKNKSEIVIGNFNQDNNPSRDYMEIFGEWFLIHRTEEQLINLGVKAGFKESQMSIGRENENVNLFLHISIES